MLCDLLKKYRDACGFSQQMLADRLKIDRSTYSCYETGKTEPSVENLRKLAHIFGVPPCRLIGEPCDTNHPDMVHDNEPIFFPEERAEREPAETVGELKREEKILISMFRILTTEQRRNLIDSLQAQCDANDEATMLPEV